mmetsp:Transcript_19381/g.33616  ORF Transcript_19381/g.33616 Transcript_19381/m.33616 type:complete len:90 (-) Transcript_19381:1938-2207(-)
MRYELWAEILLGRNAVAFLFDLSNRRERHDRPAFRGNDATPAVSLASCPAAVAAPATQQHRDKRISPVKGEWDLRLLLRSQVVLGPSER